MIRRGGPIGAAVAGLTEAGDDGSAAHAAEDGAHAGWGCAAPTYAHAHEDERDSVHRCRRALGPVRASRFAGFMNAHPYVSLPRRALRPDRLGPRRSLSTRPVVTALRRSGRFLVVAALGLLLPVLTTHPGHAVVAPADPLTGLTGDAVVAQDAAAPHVVAQHMVTPNGLPHPTDWVAPVPSPTVLRGFDPPAENWQAGHRGVDVAALPGEPIRAPAVGTVRYAGVVAGKPLVSVTVGDWVMSVENVDASVRTGDDVYPGHVIGTVASPSHCDDGCVHVGVWPDGRKTSYVDPMPFFGRGDIILLPDSEAPDELPEAPQDTGRSGAGPWGGHRNGRIPAVALCPLETAPGHLMRCDAARAFDEMSRAYQRETGSRISVTDSYRDYDTQVVLKRRKGRMAATPGTSNHGWGLAMDLGGGINRFGTPAHRWMQSNASRFGYIHPAWARQNGSLPEAWHWEYAGG